MWYIITMKATKNNEPKEKSLTFRMTFAGLAGLVWIAVMTYAHDVIHFTQHALGM